MKARALLVSLMLLLPPAAHADTPQVERLEVTEYGIYTADTKDTVASPGSVSGTHRHMNNIKVAAVTHTIPAKLNVNFGFRFTIFGSPAKAVVPVQYTYIFPSPGLRNPKTQQLQAASVVEQYVSIGPDNFVGYLMNHDWEVAPGTWTFQVRYQGRLLGEQKFTVVKE